MLMKTPAQGAITGSAEVPSREDDYGRRAARGGMLGWNALSNAFNMTVTMATVELHGISRTNRRR